MATGIPGYADLLAAVRPRSIHSEHDAQLVQQEIDRLVDLRIWTAAEEDLLIEVPPTDQEPAPGCR